LLESLFVVAAVALERDGEVFAGVDVMQRDRARVAIGDRVLEALTAQQQRQHGEAERLPRSCRAAAGQHLACGTNRHLRSRIQSTPMTDARRPQAARITNRVLLGSVNARLAPPSPYQLPKYSRTMAKTCCGPQRGRHIGPGGWGKLGARERVG